MATAEELRLALGKHMKMDIKTGADNSYVAGYWPSGVLPVDIVLGGGWRRGRMGFITGESQTLKSFIGSKTIATTQERGGTAVLIDTEHSYEPGRGAELGINNDELILIQPEYAEEAIDQMEFLVRNEVDLIVFDSIAAMLPRSDMKLMLSGKDNAQPARIAALMSIALRKLNTANEATSILWITQKRANIGGMAFAPRTNNTGGKAIEFYNSQTIELRRTNKVTEDVAYWNGGTDETYKRTIGQGFRLELTKARNRSPFAVEHFVFNYETGDVDIPLYLMSNIMTNGFVTKSGVWWTYTEVNEDGEVLDEYKAQGKEKFRELLLNTPELYNKLLTRVATENNLEVEDYGLIPEVV